MQEELKFARSDGNPSRWPVCGELEDGKRWERLESDHRHVTQYLDKLSTHLANLFGRRHEVRTLPDGYALFIQHTVVGSRQDRYLIGSCNVQRFRSPAEFAPHALWLLNDPSLENSNCLCKYCGKKQTSSVKHPRLIMSGPVAPPPSLTQRIPRTPSSLNKRITRTSSSLTQTSRSSFGGVAERLFRITRVPLALDAGNSQCRPLETNIDPLYRKGEIVWLILGEPLLLDYSGGAADGFIIRFWPSIIETGGTDGGSTSLRVRLFSSGIVYDVPQHCALPFWAYSPDGLWLQRLRLQTPQSYSSLQDPFQGFVRVAKNGSGEDIPFFLSPDDLLPHFLSDVEISLDVACSWSTTHGTSPPRSEGVPTTTQPLASIIRGQRRELWWGAEQIVLGNLVRLKIQETTLHRIGANQVWFIPRPLSDESLESTPVKDLEIEDGQLFLKLRSLAIVETNNGKELHGFGGLYRLVPTDPGFTHPLGIDPDHRNPVQPHSPEGFAFQSTLGSGWEIELSLHHLDGRYYPRLQETLTGPSGVDAHALEVLEGVACWKTPPSRPKYHKKGSREDIVAQVVRRLRKVAGGNSLRG